MTVILFKTTIVINFKPKKYLLPNGIIDKRIIVLILFFIFEGLYPSGVRIKK